MSCPKCGGDYYGISGGMGAFPKRYCTCDVRRTNRYSETGAATGISGGMNSRPTSDNVSYSYRPAASNNGDVTFLAGLVLGAIVGIVVVCVLVFLF